MKTYSVIIPAFNEEALLPRTLEAVKAAMAAVQNPGEIVVVDNNSKDRTGAVAEAHGARVVFEPVNQISRARNAGGRAARGDYLIFIDADTVVSAGLLRTALLNLEEKGVCGGGSTMQFEAAGNPKSEGVIRVWNDISRRFRLAAGCFVYCRRDGFLETGGFSENVYAGEEIFFSRRYRAWGRRRGMVFRIIEDFLVVTSSRKLVWFSPLQLYGMLAVFMVFPFAVRSRRLCWLWYRRPRSA